MDELDKQMLEVYRDHGPLGITAASSHMPVTISTCGKRRRYLVQMKWIEQVNEPVYGKNWYRITEKGLKMLDKEKAKDQRAVDLYLDTLKDEGVI